MDELFLNGRLKERWPLGEIVTILPLFFWVITKLFRSNEQASGRNGFTMEWWETVKIEVFSQKNGHPLGRSRKETRIVFKRRKRERQMWNDLIIFILFFPIILLKLFLFAAGSIQPVDLFIQCRQTGLLTWWFRSQSNRLKRKNSMSSGIEENVCLFPSTSRRAHTKCQSFL